MDASVAKGKIEFDKVNFGYTENLLFDGGVNLKGRPESRLPLLVELELVETTLVKFIDAIL